MCRHHRIYTIVAVGVLVVVGVAMYVLPPRPPHLSAQGTSDHGYLSIQERGVLYLGWREDAHGGLRGCMHGVVQDRRGMFVHALTGRLAGQHTDSTVQLFVGISTLGRRTLGVVTDTPLEGKLTDATLHIADPLNKVPTSVTFSPADWDRYLQARHTYLEHTALPFPASTPGGRISDTCGP